jgi:hypothetical protein
MGRFSNTLKWTPKGGGKKAFLFVFLLLFLTLLIWGAFTMFLIALSFPNSTLNIGALVVDSNNQALFVGIMVMIMAIITFVVFDKVIGARLLYTIKHAT